MDMSRSNGCEGCRSIGTVHGVSSAGSRSLGNGLHYDINLRTSDFHRICLFYCYIPLVWRPPESNPPVPGVDDRNSRSFSLVIYRGYYSLVPV